MFETVAQFSMEDVGTGIKSFIAFCVFVFGVCCLIQIGKAAGEGAFRSGAETFMAMVRTFIFVVIILILVVAA